MSIIDKNFLSGVKSTKKKWAIVKLQDENDSLSTRPDLRTVPSLWLQTKEACLFPTDPDFYGSFVDAAIKKGRISPGSSMTSKKIKFLCLSCKRIINFYHSLTN